MNSSDLSWARHVHSRNSKGLVIGIDATNLRRGGGITHLVELLNAASPEQYGISRVVVWGGGQTLRRLPDRDWLQKSELAPLNGNLIRRVLWQRFSLSSVARSEECDILLVPGGSFATKFRPIVTMSRNLLPFEWKELRRYGWSLMALKLVLLRYAQSRSFRDANGVIFLTQYAKRAVTAVAGDLAGQTAIVPHGLSHRFRAEPRPQRKITDYSEETPFRLIYVSILDQYKHQWRVVEAVDRLRRKGFPLVLDLIGPAYAPALARTRAAMLRVDPDGAWVKYHGSVDYQTLHDLYRHADLGIFASSCENMPNILLETMAAGLPVACSKCGPMPEVLQDAGTYFDPEDSEEISAALTALIDSPLLRREKAMSGFSKSFQYSWVTCAEQTFSFLAEIARTSKNVAELGKS